MRGKIVWWLLGIGGVVLLLMYGCTDADIASQNLSRRADYFEVPRRIVFYNWITNEYILTVEGFCSLGWWWNENEEIRILCKDGDGYKKHFLWLSDNVTYIVEQIDGANVSPNHYKIIFKPSAIVPSFEIK